LTRIRLALPSDFSFDGVVRSHGWYDLLPFSYDREKGVLTTVVEVHPHPLGEGGGEERARAKLAASISFRARAGRLEADSESLDRRRLSSIARRVFSLDVDLDSFARTIAEEPDLARALASGRGRILRAPTLFEDAVKILLTTNCSWAATKGMVSRLIALAGAGGRAFPSAGAIAAFSPARLKAKVRCGYRAASLARFARRVGRGELDLAKWQRPGEPVDEIRDAILAEHGFGPYAAEGLLRILGRHDYLALDSWVRQEYRRRFPGPRRTTDRAIARRYARYGVHRGLALWLDMTSHWHDGSESAAL
jgi:3-methyladenine DNA glycosylase/8-oxoguanine DNA glycosylase